MCSYVYDITLYCQFACACQKRFISYEHQMKIKYNFRMAAMLFLYILEDYIEVKILNIYYQTKPQDPKPSVASAAPTSQIRVSAMLLFIIYIYIYIYICPVALRGSWPLILEVSRSHKTTHHWR